ncbi:MAG: hypothetical protein LBR85_06765 [Oscillospiraceae bacterium]|jgi:hypothetical protein|nr:hypothetical protein [Oscillospiraceae bacterium]
MKQSLKALIWITSILAVAATATLLIIKYFDILVSLALDIKEKISAKKTALFSTTCCADDDDEDLDLSFEDLDFETAKEDV